METILKLVAMKLFRDRCGTWRIWSGARFRLSSYLPWGVALAAALALEGQASTVRWEASQLFDQSVTEQIRLDRDGSALELESGELFEDDGPAAGHSYRKPENRETVTPTVWIKKTLHIPNPQARTAHMVILSGEPTECLINGQVQSFGPNESGRDQYKTYRFDPKLLREGLNEIILRNSGRVMIARDDEFALGSRTRLHSPNRSAKSTDAGQTWDDAHLGPEGRLDGEYGIRVFLDHYRPTGMLTTPVYDLGNLDGRSLPKLLDESGSVRIRAHVTTAPSGGVRLRIRSGTTYVPAPSAWSEWSSWVKSEVSANSLRGRYFQVAVELGTADPLRSPRFTSLEVETSSAATVGWTSQTHVLEEHNEKIIRSSVPFAYEPLRHERLRTLRETYHLDDVVRGARTDLELMLRLAQWACNAWDWPNHITESYPAWDALEILKSHPDGKPVGGFCQQFNLVFLQACESFGFNGRAISISQGSWQERRPAGGHEIVELWSNEFRKWVYVDGALAWYVVDAQSNVPLSMWELRQRQLPTLRGEPIRPVRVVAADRTRNKQFGWKGVEGPDPSNWYLELRLIPRSNFLEEKSPLPLNQGTEEWAWTGHHVWTDVEVPAGLLFGNRVSKRNDFEWTLNQAHYTLEPMSEPGVWRVHLDTETPSFDTFLSEVDAGPKTAIVSPFTWKLHVGQNRLRVTPRNNAGREGISSWIALEYQP